MGHIPKRCHSHVVALKHCPVISRVYILVLFFCSRHRAQLAYTQVKYGMFGRARVQSVLVIPTAHNVFPCIFYIVNGVHMPVGRKKQGSTGPVVRRTYGPGVKLYSFRPIINNYSK